MKKAAIAIAAVVGVAGAGYLVYRASATKNIADALKNAPSGTAEKILKSQSLDGLDDATKKLISDAFKNAGHDADYVLQAGQTFHRMHGFDDLDLNKAGDGVLYAAYKNADIETYKAFLGDFAGTGKRYDISLKAVNDIIVPGDAQAAKIFDMLCKNDSAYTADIKRAYAQLIKQRLPAGTPTALADRFANAQADAEFSNNSFNTMMAAFAVPGEAQTKMKQALKAAGYNAVFDYHDINDKVAKKPVIFIDAASDLIKDGARFVSADERVKAIHNIAVDASVTDNVRARAQQMVNMYTDRQIKAALGM